MVLKPRAVPAPIWFSLLLAIEGVGMFCLLLATVDPHLIPTFALSWLQGELTIVIGLYLQLTLASGVFAGLWAVTRTLSALRRAAGQIVDASAHASERSVTASGASQVLAAEGSSSFPRIQ